MDGFVLYKILGALIDPLFILLVLTVPALIGVKLQTKSKRHSGYYVLVLAVCTLWFASTRVVGLQLIASLQDNFPAININEHPPADYVVLLGGGVIVPSGVGTESQLGLAGQRVLHSFRLMKANVAPKMIISAGNVFGGSAAKSEAHYTAEILASWGINTDQMVLDSSSRTTGENALFTEQLIEGKVNPRLVLVTSSYHMPRAVAQFENLGLVVTPSPTNFVSTISEGEPLLPHLVPSTAGLSLTNTAIHEYVGLMKLRFEQWLKQRKDTQVQVAKMKNA